MVTFAPRPGGVDEVLFAVADGVGHVLLTRPRAINSLSHAMVGDLAATLIQWRADPRIDEVVVRGAGERGLCAGGDIKAARAAILAGEPGKAARFWADEYALFGLIAAYPKPVEVVMAGVVMGGGLGLGMHAQRRPVSPDARLAMPETGIGFFPDAGSTQVLARAPGELGTYLALTGAVVSAADAIAVGLADDIDVREPTTAPLLREREWIDACFAGDDPGAIAGRLERHTANRARACGELLRSRSPLSVAIALERIRRAAGETELDETLAVDAHVAAAMMHDSDFVEGVRATVIDRDTPRWRHARIEDVPRDAVLGYFP
ncbi:MAG: enoyl-CoA hydratase/isomerase family protein [Tetrasphaera sp.]